MAPAGAISSAETDSSRREVRRRACCDEQSVPGEPRPAASASTDGFIQKPIDPLTFLDTVTGIMVRNAGAAHTPMSAYGYERT